MKLFNRKNEELEINKIKRKKNIFFRILLYLITIGIIVFAFKVTPIIVRGYNMYKSAISSISIEKRIAKIKRDNNYTELEDISDEFIKEVLRSEDKRFYKHSGIDLVSTGRAVINNFKAGSYVEGGSTITQQLSKNLYFSFEKKYERKIAELFISFDMEKLLTKDEILELYCNIAYFGEGNYGINEASNYYYDVSPMEINEDQIMTLVKTLKCPNYYNPNAIEK